MGHTSIVLTRQLQKGAMQKGQQKLHQVAVQECRYCDGISRDTHAQPMQRMSRQFREKKKKRKSKKKKEKAKEKSVIEHELLHFWRGHG